MLQFHSILCGDEMNRQFRHFTTLLFGFKYKALLSLQCEQYIFSLTTGSQCGFFNVAWKKVFLLSCISQL